MDLSFQVSLTHLFFAPDFDFICHRIFLFSYYLHSRQLKIFSSSRCVLLMVLVIFFRQKEEKVMSLRERQLKDRSDSAISTASSAALLTTCPSSPSSDITCPIDGGGEGEDGGGVNYRNRLFFARTPSDLSPDQNRTLFNV